MTTLTRKAVSKTHSLWAAFVRVAGTDTTMTRTRMWLSVSRSRGSFFVYRAGTNTAKRHWSAGKYERLRDDTSAEAEAIREEDGTRRVCVGSGNWASRRDVLDVQAHLPEADGENLHQVRTDGSPLDGWRRHRHQSQGARLQQVGSIAMTHPYTPRSLAEM